MAADRQQLLDELRASIRILNQGARCYRTWHVLLLLVSLVSGLLATHVKDATLDAVRADYAKLLKNTLIISTNACRFPLSRRSRQS